MADRSKRGLNEFIEQQIKIWDGTVFGLTIKRMYENSSAYEDICEVLEVNMDDFSEENE